MLNLLDHRVSRGRYMLECTPYTGYTFTSQSHRDGEQEEPPMTYDTILVPTDGSDAVDSAIEHALELAEAFNSTVHALYVADTNRDSVTLVGTDVVDALVEVGDEAVESIVKRGENRGVPVVDEVVQGDPTTTIVDYAAGHDIDLIVMSSHGRRGLPRYLLGSVTERVARTTDVPVMIVSVDG